ncbi:related to 1-phosphatidylinositol-4,5-bisphosphate phosphodiesterase [Fusarium fujikuroi]|nr:related to 1-phosphatidylinositol-4,5-bisphosphate phosphodiesterase [Fusarium fujikuroi]
MDLMSLSARDLSNKCLESFQTCLTFRSPDPGLSNRDASHDERFEYRLADFNLWIDGIGALASSKASLDARLSERPIDLSLVKGNLVMLFQSLEDCLNLLKDNESVEDALLDIDSALESLLTLSLAIRRTGRRSRLHKADRLFKPDDHAELRKHLEAIILLRPRPGPYFKDDEFRTEIKSLTPLQNHLVTANLKRRNRFIQAQLHSLGLKKRSVGFELSVPGIVQQNTALVSSPEIMMEEIDISTSAPASQLSMNPLPKPMSITSASFPESKLQYKEPISKSTESTPMSVITQTTASARYPRPRVPEDGQKVVQCPCCCQTLPVSEAKNNNRWRKHLAEDIRPYTCIFERCPAPDVYFSSRSMLEQHFRQDHPPVWVCPLCDQDSVYPTMTEMMDHLHDAHAQDVGDDISSLISLSAQIRMGIESCPLCDVKGEVDSTELIDHVLEHVHDFSLRSLPWPRSSEVDIGGEVGSFDAESDEAVAITQWLEVYERETENANPTTKLSNCDYGRLAIITEQIASGKQDKLGLDIGFADEHGDESAEAETDVSRITQRTAESVEQASDMVDPESGSQASYIVETNMEPHFARRDSLGGHREESGDSRNATASKPSAQGSTSGFRKLTDRLFSRKKTDSVEPRLGQEAAENLVPFLGFKQKPMADQVAGKILTNIYHRRLDYPTNTPALFASFIRGIQHEEVLSTHPPVSDLNSFLEVMVGFYMKPLKPLPPKDLSKPISNYFINSSHRTTFNASSGSRSACDAIKELLYCGCRSIDMDVRNGTTITEKQDIQVNQPRGAKSEGAAKTINRLFSLNRPTNAPKPMDPKTTVSLSSQLSSSPEPIVTDGVSLITPCGFREACQVIRKAAFISTDLPVIVNIVVYADPDQQHMMVKIMKEEWRDILVDKPLEDCDPRFRLPTLEDLRGRILFRLGTTIGPVFENYGGSDDAQLDENRHRSGRFPMIQPLAKLGVYLRHETFESFYTLSSKLPAHMYSLQQGKVQELISTSPIDLFQHNQNYFFRVYPNKVGQDFSNLNPLQFWRHGFQIASIDRQQIDEGMMLNEGMFADESGWVLKPDGFKSSNKDLSTDVGAAPRKELAMSMFVFLGQEFISDTHRELKDLSSCLSASLYLNDEQDAYRAENDFLISTDNGSSTLGYNLHFRVTRAKTSIIPKLSILR